MSLWEKQGRKSQGKIIKREISYDPYLYHMYNVEHYLEIQSKYEENGIKTSLIW